MMKNKVDARKKRFDDILVNKARVYYLNTEGLAANIQLFMQIRHENYAGRNVDKYDNILNDLRKKHSSNPLLHFREDDNYIFFQSSNSVLSDAPVRLFVPLNLNKFQKNVNLIIEYLKTSNMYYMARINKDYTCIGLELLFENPNDANRLISFIKDEIANNDFEETLPIMPQKQNIEMNVCTPYISYDLVVSTLIALYLKINHESPNTDEFLEFVKHYYHNRFMEYRDIEETINDFNIRNNIEQTLYSIKINMMQLIGTLENKDTDNLIRNTFNKATSQREKSLNDFIFTTQQGKEIDLKEINDYLLTIFYSFTERYNQDTASRVINYFFIHGGVYNVKKINESLFEADGEIIALNDALHNRCIQEKVKYIVSKYKIKFSTYFQEVLNYSDEKYIENLIATYIAQYDRETALALLRGHLDPQSAPLLPNNHDFIPDQLHCKVAISAIESILKKNRITFEQYVDYIHSKYFKKRRSY